MTNIAATTDIAASGARGDMRQVVARLERLPYCSWHLNMRLIICTAWFFDAFDSIAIAYVLPPLIGPWHLTPQDIGSLIGIGFAGQLIGALAFGWIAEHWGRRRSMLATLLIFSLGALACAAATSYAMLWWLRFIQGIGLGGEIPLMAAYVNEFARAKGRGRFSLKVQVLFSIGLLAVALVGVYVVPHWGWQLDVHHRRRSGAVGDSAAQPAAGIAALAREPGPLRRGRPRLDADRGDRRARRQADSRAAGAICPLVAEVAAAHRRPVQGHLSAPHDLGVAPVDRRLFRVLRHHRLGAVAVPHRLSPAGRAIVGLRLHHERRRAVRRVPRALSDRGDRAAADVHRQPRRLLPVPVFPSRSCRSSSAAGTLAITTCGFFFLSFSLLGARDLHGGNLSDAAARAGRRRRQRLAARRLDGRHHRGRLRSCRTGASTPSSSCSGCSR